MNKLQQIPQNLSWYNRGLVIMSYRSGYHYAAHIAQLYQVILRQQYTVKVLFQSISWNTVSIAFYKTWNSFMKSFSLTFKFYCV